MSTIFIRTAFCSCGVINKMTTSRKKQDGVKLKSDLFKYYLMYLVLTLCPSLSLPLRAACLGWKTNKEEIAAG